jgi:Kef-type K+ transport system membrane component KefB
MSSRFRLPVVVVELLLGVVIGPHLLGLISPDGLVGMLGELGLTFDFSAGNEPMKLA